MTRLLTVILIAAMALWGQACTIIDPLLIAINLPLEVCAAVNAGNAWDEQDSYNIEEEIEEVSVDYLDDVKATRVSDILVYMPNPPASGTATGQVSFQFPGDPVFTELATFSAVPFAALNSPGISILDPTHFTYNPVALARLLLFLQDPTGLPTLTTVTIHTSGTTSVAVPGGTQICANFAYQVDVEI